MGFKEELREEGRSEGFISEAVRKITEAVETEKRPPDLERIKEELTTPRENPAVVEQPTEAQKLAWETGAERPFTFDAKGFTF
jgi:hypothetical protein